MDVLNIYFAMQLNKIPGIILILFFTMFNDDLSAQLSVSPCDDADNVTDFINPPSSIILSCDEWSTFVPVTLSYFNNQEGACEISGSVAPTLTGNNDSCGGLITYSWEFTDVCGRFISHIQEVTIEPSMIAAFVDPPSDVIINCDEAETFSPNTLTYTNESNGACLIEGTVEAIADGTFDICGNSVTYIWEFVDECGQIINHNQTVSLSPIPEASFINPPPSITITCEEWSTFTPPTLSYSNNQNGMCEISGSVSTIFTEPQEPCGTDISYNWEFTDVCGRFISHTQVVTVMQTVMSQNLSFDDVQPIIDFPDESLGLRSPVLALDFNDDGITDFIRKSNGIAIYKGLSDGSFEEIENTLDSKNPLKSIDFDQDGDLDVIMETYIAIQESDETFTQFDLTVFGVIIEAADFNNDGEVDLMSHANDNNNFADEELRIYYNQGDGTFIFETISSGLVYGEVDLGDIDGDGDLDIVAIDYLEDFPIMVFTNEEDSFTMQRTLHPYILSKANIYLIDLDNDSDLDILTNSSSGGLRIIENKEDFLLSNLSKAISTPQIIYMNHADLNNDGKEDIVFFGGNNFDAINIYALESKGGFDFEDRIIIGAFDRPPGFSYPNDNYTSNNINLYDYNTDDKLDIIYTDGFSKINQLVIFENETVISNISDRYSDLPSFQIFPNPVSNRIYLSDYNSLNVKNSEYEIISMDGQVIKRGTINMNQGIQIEEFQNGLYFLRLIENNQIISFVKD